MDKQIKNVLKANNLFPEAKCSFCKGKGLSSMNPVILCTCLKNAHGAIPSRKRYVEATEEIRSLFRKKA